MIYRHEPVGVCGQIIPWNFPLLMQVIYHNQHISFVHCLGRLFSQTNLNVEEFLKNTHVSLAIFSTIIGLMRILGE